MDFNEGIDFIGNERSDRNWQEIIFSKAIEVNPRRPLKKGDAAKFIGMTDLKPFQRKVSTYSIREFEGGGSKFKNGDTLLARITPCLENGKTALVNILGEHEIGFGSTEFIVLSAKQMKSDPFYIYYLVRSPTLRRIIIKSMTGTSGRQRVENSVFDKITLSLPSLSEQSAIGQFLSTFDSKIEINKKMNKNLEAIGQAVFKRWFVDFEFSDEEGKPYKSSGGEMVDSEIREIPIGWVISSLDRLHDKNENCVITGPFGSNLHASDYRETGKPLILVKHVKAGRIIGEDMPLVGNHKFPEMNRYILKIGDIVFTRVAVVGESAYIRKRNENWMISGQMLRVRANRNMINPRYLAQVFQQDIFKDQVSNYAVGSTRPSLNTKLLLSFKFVLPPLILQESFYALLENADAQIENNLNQIDTLSSIRDLLLPKLMSGKIRVPITEENVEAK